jgi:hypothetical protein
LRIELYDHRRANVPIPNALIRGKNMVTLLMPEEQDYRVRNETVARLINIVSQQVANRNTRYSELGIADPGTA